MTSSMGIFCKDVFLEAFNIKPCLEPEVTMEHAYSYVLETGLQFVKSVQNRVADFNYILL